MARIGFLGAGNMAEALIKGIIAAKLYEPKDVWISDVRSERLDQLQQDYGVSAAADNAGCASGVDIVVLSIKPQTMGDVLAELRGSVAADKLVISIAAGVKTSKIAAALGDAAVIRVMPNTPALVGEGMSALFSATANEGQLQSAMSIFSAIGKAVVVDKEELIDAVTAVSGSGPAYYFLLMEQMIAAAESLGLPPESAKELVLQTAKGAAILAQTADARGETPAELRNKVTSPGGTTEAALKVFSEKGFADMVRAALTAARDRSEELSK